jgi:hypothetical protein
MKQMAFFLGSGSDYTANDVPEVAGAKERKNRLLGEALREFAPSSSGRLAEAIFNK